MTVNAIQFAVPGEPQGKGRARAFRMGGSIRMVTPGKTVAYEGLVAMAARQAMAGDAPWRCPVAIEVDAIFALPKTAPKWLRVAVESGRRVHVTKKPDGDNILKAVCDGGNGVVWHDDALAAVQTVRKFYGPTPMVVVRVAQL